VTVTRSLGYVLLTLILLLPVGNGMQDNIMLFVGQTLVVLLLLLHTFRLRSSPVELNADHLDILIGLYAAVAFSSVFLADYRYAAVVQFSAIALGVVLYLTTRWWLDNEGRAATLLPPAIACSALLCAIYGLMLCGFERGRARGFFEDPNGFAALCNVGLAMLLPFARVRQPASSSRVWGVGRVAAIALLLISVVLSQSRGGLLGTLVLLTILLIRVRRSWVLLAAASVLFSVLLVPQFRDKILHPKQTDSLALRRFDIYMMDFRMIAAYPACGVGLGQFPWYAPRFNFPLDDQPVRFSKLASTAHSDPLQVFVELGIPGGALFLGIMACILVAASDRDQTELSLRGSTALLVLCLHGLFHHLLLTDGLLFLWFLLLATLPKSHPRTPFVEAARWQIRLGGGRARALGATALLSALWLFGVFVPYEGDRQMARAGEMRQGSPVDAQAAIRRALALVPIQPYYHQSMADLYEWYFERTGNVEAMARAVTELERAVDLNPNERVFHHKLAALYSLAMERGLATEEMMEAYLNELTRESELNPMSPVPLLHLAQLDLHVGRIDEAEGRLRAALALEPNYVQARFELRKVFKARSDWGAYDLETARLRETRRRWAREADNPRYRDILALTDEMRREFE